MFCLERNIFVCIFGPGPFGSRSQLFFQNTLLCLQGGTARLRSWFCFGTNCFVYTARDRAAPGAGFCLKTSIGVCGPGTFGSGSLFFVWNEFFVGSAQGAGVFFCLEWNIIVCGLGPLGSGSLYWSGTVSLRKPVLHLPKIIVIRPNRPFGSGIWSIQDLFTVNFPRLHPHSLSHGSRFFSSWTERWSGRITFPFSHLPGFHC